MTYDGKVMSVTAKELGGITLAAGGAPDEGFEVGMWSLGAVHLGMTYETMLRWINGHERDEKRTAPWLQQKRARERKRWYA